MKSNPAFSALLSIYHKENPEYFHQAMQSIWQEQSVKPNEIVLVEDGPLTPELYTAIDHWETMLYPYFRRIVLEKNEGLGGALNHGIAACSHPLIARMDTDDIASPKRFEKQLQCFEKYTVDVCGGWISEFDSDPNCIVSMRKVPKTHKEIVLFAKKRNPMNHPAIMYRKNVLEKVGGYHPVSSFEDYDLWVRLIQYGAHFHNLPEPLVNMRTGAGQLERRRGIRYALNELKFQQTLLQSGFITPLEFARNTSIRFIARIIPSNILKRIYRKLRSDL